ncbi:MAG: deoxyribodipyrimidine photo-lyase [Bacteroidetes bacterium]|nr:deoxyribodipyrimidine photo-lyase [Bacteroidota bacterium]
MSNKAPVSICWLRRDLRLDDNTALFHALTSPYPVVVLFIFDQNILSKLENKTDKRVLFIYQQIIRLSSELQQHGSSLLVKYGNPVEVWKALLNEWNVKSVHVNHDYESYGVQRDRQVAQLLSEKGASFQSYKDVVVFEKEEVMKDDGTPYVVFTPYSRKWKELLSRRGFQIYNTSEHFQHFFKMYSKPVLPLAEIGFHASDFSFPAKVIKSDIVNRYAEQRDFPAIEGTSRLSVHLRFGTLSVRKLLQYALSKSNTFVNELIWRDFYHSILYHFPYVEKGSFRKQYDAIPWLNNEEHFARWCAGTTGYPLVDAGMRELNETGFMHNRVRMVVSSFLTKHLLTDWRWGEAYFAQKLLDYDLAANVGGWQWAAGCGTDAAPYFRIFNPASQAVRFDPKNEYIKRWVPEFGTTAYPAPIVEHEMARNRCLATYKKALGSV